jgi:hypothetical protein
MGRTAVRNDGVRWEIDRWRVEWWECCRDPSTARRLKGADAPVPSRLRAGGLTVMGSWLKPRTYTQAG